MSGGNSCVGTEWMAAHRDDVIGECEAMVSREGLREELDWASAKISSQIWVLNLGILGTTWSLLLSGSAERTDAARLKFTFVEARWIFVFCLLGLFCDLAQYL